MTEAQRETQERLDAYLADDRQPRAVDFVIEAARSGHRAFEPRWDVVAPIRHEYLTSRRA
jgi:hypothetical protein